MSSTSNSSLYDREVEEFLAKYMLPETQQQFKELAAHTKEKCEEILNEIPVKGVVQCRTKGYESLRKKLEDMAQDSQFRDWVSNGKDNIYKHQEMGDLAGIRIGLYLPDDVVKVVKQIENCFNIEHCFGTVTGGRDATQGRNLDIQKHTNGPWHSRDLDGGDEYWEHSGYKSWQMVVNWKWPLERFNSLRVEIQVGTVVTQAWAEVQHNIIYKRPNDILSTPTMKRMIDAINGLAITTEIILKELGPSLEQAKKEAEKRSLTPFGLGRKFLDWFQLTYMSQMRPEERQRWDCSNDNNAQFLLLSWENTPYSPPACPANFKQVIDQKGLLQPERASGESDISVHILRALYDTEKSFAPIGWCQLSFEGLIGLVHPTIPLTPNDLKNAYAPNYCS